MFVFSAFELEHHLKMPRFRLVGISCPGFPDCPEQPSPCPAPECRPSAWPSLSPPPLRPEGQGRAESDPSKFRHSSFSCPWTLPSLVVADLQVYPEPRRVGSWVFLPSFGHDTSCPQPREPLLPCAGFCRCMTSVMHPCEAKAPHLQLQRCTCPISVPHKHRSGRRGCR